MSLNNIEITKFTRSSFGARKLLLSFLRDPKNNNKLHAFRLENLHGFVIFNARTGVASVIKIQDNNVSCPDFLALINEWPICSSVETSSCVREYNHNRSMLFDAEEVFTGDNLAEINNSLAPETVRMGGIRITQKASRRGKGRKPLTARNRNRAINRKDASYKKSLRMADRIIDNMDDNDERTYRGEFYDNEYEVTYHD